MLINQIELETLAVSKQAQADLAVQVLNQLRREVYSADEGKEVRSIPPLRAYATARALLNVFEFVAQEAGVEAEHYCEVNNLGDDGQWFSDGELTFNRQFNLDYNYGDNDSHFDTLTQKFEPNIPRLYTFEQAREKCIEKQKELTQTIAQRKKDILTEHPNMVPQVLKVIMKFIGTDEEAAEKLKGEN